MTQPTDLKPGDIVVYEHYGEKREGVVSRIGESGIVFLTDGRWLHRESVQLKEKQRGTARHTR